MDGETQPHRTTVGVHERFDQNLVVAEVAGADPAEAFVGREAQQPDVTGLGEHLPRNDAVGVPFGEVRSDLLGREIAREFGKGVVVGVVVHPLHRRSVGRPAAWVSTRVPLSRQSHRRHRRTPRYFTVVTTDADTTAAPNRADPDELRANLRQADPGVLVAVLAQITGDTAVIDRFGPAISHVPDPPERAGVTDPDTAEALVQAVIEALERPRPDDALAADDPELFRRVLPLALGSAVDDEFVPLLLEQGGFQLSQPTLPRTTPIPPTMTVAIVGAGLAGIITALAAADAGSRTNSWIATPKSAARG